MSDPRTNIGKGAGGVDGRFPSEGPTIDPSCPDPRGGFQSTPDAAMYAAFDNGAFRDLNTGEVFHRYPDH